MVQELRELPSPVERTQREIRLLQIINTLGGLSPSERMALAVGVPYNRENPGTNEEWAENFYGKRVGDIKTPVLTFMAIRRRALQRTSGGIQMAEVNLEDNKRKGYYLEAVGGTEQQIQPFTVISPSGTQEVVKERSPKPQLYVLPPSNSRPVNQTLSQEDEQDFKAMERVREGDSEAFGEIYQRRFKGVYKQIYYRTGNPTLAEDLTQEVFTRAFKAGPRFVPNKRVSVWLSSIAHNLYVDQYRSQRYTDSTDEVEIAADYKSDPEEQAIINDENTKLREAVTKLKPKHQAIVHKRYYDGMSFRDIAHDLQRPEVTVRVMEHRIKRKLEKALKHSIY